MRILPTLENLPIEIAKQILELSDLKSLLNLVLATRTFAEVYGAHTKVIMSQMVHNTIPKYVLSLALETHGLRLVCAVRGLGHIRTVREYRLALEERRQHFFLNKETSCIKDTKVFSIQTSISLLRFHEAVIPNLAAEYRQSRTDMLAKFFNSSCRQLESPDLSGVRPNPEVDLHDILCKSSSATENARIQRGLCLFEFYGLLFQGQVLNDKWHLSEPPGTRLRSTLSQISWFFDSLPLFQLEEFLCIRSFFRDRLRNFMAGFSDVFDNHQELLDVLRNLHTNEVFPILVWLDSSKVLLQEYEDWIDKSLALGLCNLYKLGDLPECSRTFKFQVLRSALNNVGQTLPTTNDLVGGLNRLPVSKHSYKHRVARGRRYFKRDQIETSAWPNLGIVWVCSEYFHPRDLRNFAEDPHILSLRRWGYVMWDQETFCHLNHLMHWYCDMPNGGWRILENFDKGRGLKITEADGHPRRVNLPESDSEE